MCRLLDQRTSLNFQSFSVVALSPLDLFDSIILALPIATAAAQGSGVTVVTSTITLRRSDCTTRYAEIVTPCSRYLMH